MKINKRIMEKNSPASFSWPYRFITSKMIQCLGFYGFDENKIDDKDDKMIKKDLRSINS